MSYFAAEQGIIDLLQSYLDNATDSTIKDCAIVPALGDADVEREMKRHAFCIMVAYYGDIADTAASGVTTTDVSQSYLVLVGARRGYADDASEMLTGIRESLVGRKPAETHSPLSQFVINNDAGRPMYDDKSVFYPLFFKTVLRLINRRR